MIKMVCFDLDGTVLDENSSLTNASIHAIMDLMEAGIVFATNSGRSVRRSQEPLVEWPDMASNLLVGAYNGGVVVDRERDGHRKLIYVKRLPSDVFEEIVVFSKEMEINLVCCMCEEKGGLLKEEYRHSLAGTELKLFGGPGFVHDRNLHEKILKNELMSPPKLMLITGESERDRVLGKVRKRWGQRIYATWSIPDRIEIMPLCVNKSKSLIALADLVGIGMDQVLAVGDGENDIPMLNMAGQGILMGNADTIVRRGVEDSSVSIGPTFAQDGFSSTLRKFIKI